MTESITISNEDGDTNKEAKQAEILAAAKELVDPAKFDVTVAGGGDLTVSQKASFTQGGKASITLTVKEKDGVGTGQSKEVTLNFTFDELDQSVEDAKAAVEDAVGEVQTEVEAKGSSVSTYQSDSGEGILSEINNKLDDTELKKSKYKIAWATEGDKAYKYDAESEGDHVTITGTIEVQDQTQGDAVVAEVSFNAYVATGE